MTEGRRTALAVVLITAAHLGLVRFLNPVFPVVWIELALLGVVWFLVHRRTVSIKPALCYTTAMCSLLGEPAVGFGYVIWLFMVPMLWLLELEKRPGRLLFWGLWIGFLLSSGIYAWIWDSLHRFFGFGDVKAGALFVLLSLLIGLHYGLFLPVTAWLIRILPIPGYLTSALIFALLEFWRPLPFTVDLPLVFANQPFLLQPLDIAGVQSVTFLIAIVSACLYEIMRRRRASISFREPALVAGGVVAFHMVYSFATWTSCAPADGEGNVHVAMVQPISPLRVMNDDTETQQKAANTLRELSIKAIESSPQTPDLLIWPEGAAHFATRTPQFNPPYCEALSDIQRLTSATLLVQDIEFTRLPDSDRVRYYSTATLVEPVGRPTRGYRKNILMPFGEYLPLERQFPFLRRIFRQSRSILPGTEVNTLSIPKGEFLPLICYEILFADFVRTNLDSQTGFIVSLTNDRWYGERQQPMQHLAFARLRAIENRRPVARATNSGITAIVDARGHVPDSAMTTVMERTWLLGSLEPVSGRTLYNRLGGRFFSHFLTPALGLVILYVYSPWRRRGKDSEPSATPPGAQRRIRGKPPVPKR